MPNLPSGTVAFLFTDIEGSTALWERDPTSMRAAVDRHLTLLTTAVAAHGGVHFKTVGDAIQAVFATAPAALAAAVDAQLALAAGPWARTGPLRARMAIHAGEATPGKDDYLSPTLNRLQQVLGAGHGGQVLLTNAARALAVHGLPPDASLVDLGEHRLRDLLEPEQLFQLVHPGLANDFPPLRTLDARQTNLPRQPNLFFGRERELEEITELLRDDQIRLLSLTGPGGAGKTRLALHAAAELLDSFPDGIYLVPLAAVTDAELTPGAIATTLGLRETGGQPARDQLHEWLAEKRMLLILDNLEQLPDVASFVGEMLSAAPSLTVLATSRAPLRLRAEREYPVPPLPLPPEGLFLDSADISGFDAVRLFVDRAQAVKPEFILDETNAASVRGIVRRLDGLPLAIELAAARIRLFAPQAMLARLDKRLPLLTGGARDLPARQRALHETIAWSYDLLQPEDRNVFRCLALFAGGFTLEAAGAAIGASDELDVLDSVDRLAEQSLLHVQVEIEVKTGDADSPRYQMLETIREYGLERLAKAGELDDVSSRHAAFFLQLGERAAPELDGPQQGEWLDRISAEHDNLNAALEWASDRQEETALRLAAALWLFWEARGLYSEGRTWLERLLARDVSAPRPALAAALSGAGSIARMQGDSSRAIELLERALPLWQELGDRHGAARTLLTLGHVADRQGDLTTAATRFDEALAIGREIDDTLLIAAALGNLGLVADQQGAYAVAVAHYEEALALFRQLGNRRREASVLDNLGIVARAQGQLAEATRLYEAALEVRREIGDTWGIAATLGNLGVAHHQGGDLDLARDYYEQSLEGFRKLGDRRGIGHTLGNLGVAERQGGNLPQAANLLREGLEISRELGDRAGIAIALEGIAAVAASAGEPEGAARLFGAAETLREAIGMPLTPDDRADYDRSVAAARFRLDDNTFSSRWKAGRGLGLEDAVTEALALAREIAAAGASGRS